MNELDSIDHDLLSVAEARECLRKARAAFETYRSFDQERVDRITKAAVDAGYAASAELARMAVEETGIGNVAGKTAKNQFSTLGLWEGIASMPTCGIIREDRAQGLWEIADPFGVVAAIIPTTNPAATALFKGIICLKSRNGMVASPHPRALRSIRRAVSIVSEAAEAAGAPKGLLQCLSRVSLEATQELMTHKLTDLILATGGSAMVRAAYSSGKPAYGVGPGNVPVYVHPSADLGNAARCIVESQTFDNGTVCASEQAIVADRAIAASLLDELKALGAVVLTPDQKAKMGTVAIKNGIMNPAIVGLDACALARFAGFEVPAGTTVLLAPHRNDEVGKEHPLSLEKLCPLLAWYEADGWMEGCELALAILNLGGRGHTLGLHCEDEELIRRFALEKPANRIVVNSPTTQGAVGLSTALFPSMTLGCGSFGGNITSDNIGPQHLLNRKRVAFVLPSWRGEKKASTPAAAAPAAPGQAAKESDRVESPDSGGLSRERLPGEHYSEADLRRIIEDAIRRRQERTGLE